MHTPEGNVCERKRGSRQKGEKKKQKRGKRKKTWRRCVFSAASVSREMERGEQPISDQEFAAFLISYLLFFV